MPIRYFGDTSGLPNWVSSLSRAWRDDPDDSFEFTIPVTGRYRITVDAGISDLGLTFRNIDGSLHSTRDCPDAGYLMLDRALIVWDEDAVFDAGTRVLVWLSIPDWLPQTPTGTYELSVSRH